MKKIILIVTCAASISAYALPTYEPFSEYAAAIAASGSNSVNLCTGGFTAPSGEQWGSLNFSGTAGTGLKGVDVYVTNYSAGSVFTAAALGSILPNGFPGLPSAGNSINILCVNPAQPLVGGAASANIVGNSAVLKFAQDITRPTSGTKTLFVSYLFSVAQKGQAGPNNVGRYLGFLASTNLVEPSASYTTWAQMFNTFGTTATSPKNFGHGILAPSGIELEPPDSSAGKSPASGPTTFPLSFNTPYFIVGEFVFTTSGTTSLPDTNIVWVNPSISSFGGPTPLASPLIANPLAINMGDVGGMAIIDRPGSGAAGGIGTNYICNLIIGSTWSYVTGGPEFTNQPVANTAVNIGGNASLRADATAAGQSVSYQWVKITGGLTNNVTNGSGGAGGAATVSGATTHILSLAGVSAGDTGDFQCIATASSTGFALNSANAVIQLADPQVTSNPANTTTGFGQSASFTATVTTANAPLNYRWYLGSTPLNNGAQPDGSSAANASGTTGAGTSFTLTLTLNNVSYQDIGSYTLFVTNTLNLQNSAAAASLYVFDPFIVTPPANPSVADGGNATFSVAVTGSPTISYQWYEGATPLSNGGTTVGGSAVVSGADTATLTLTGVQDADNGTYYCQVNSTGSGQTTNSPSAVLVVQDPLTITAQPKSLVERAGEHVAFTVGVTGGGPTFVWSRNGTIISSATGSSLVLTNIQSAANAGTYSVTVSNLATAGQVFSRTLTVIDSPVLSLAKTNLIVARVGDGAQALSLTTGNTIYLDQYTTNGIYVNSSQIPDEATSQPYGAGSVSSVIGSPALIVAGAGGDAPVEAMLNLSYNDKGYLTFAGYCQAYPFTGGNVNSQPGNSWRGLATVNAFGIYNLAYTNSGLYSGGGQLIRDTATLEGTNFWTTGAATAGTVKFVSASPAGAPYANGGGVPSSTGVSGSGGTTIQVVNGPLPISTIASTNSYVVVAETAAGTANGLYAVAGTPEPTAGSIAFTKLFSTGQDSVTALPGDFAFSPDGMTLYVADSRAFTGTSDIGSGGIQRWDSDGSTYNYTYTIQPIATPAVGAQGLTVDFSAATTWGPGVNGAIIYATTAGAAGNSLVSIVDTGAASASTVLAAAGPNQALRGVRFGPVGMAPVIASLSPATQTIPVGNSATFSVVASGSAPFYYQWSFNGGAGAVPLAGATSSTFTTNNISFASAGTYSVVVSNLTTQTTSGSGVLTVTAGAPTIGALPNYTETVGDHLAWGPTVTGTQPYTNYWYEGSTLIQTNVTPSASGSLALTNIQLGDAGTYTLKVTNFYGFAAASGTLTITSAKQTLSPANIVVARVGDGAQTLSAATGNTLYLDQYTPGGGLVNTIQIPDQGAGQPYSTGGSSSASLNGSPAMLFAGTGADAPYEAFLALSPDGESINFAGYCQAYPFSGPDVSVIAGGSGNWHGIGGVDAYGYYSMFFTNTGLYSAGGHQVHGAADLYGTGTNFYSTGEAGSGFGIKYLNINFQPASGNGIASVAGTFTGTRAVHIVGGNLVFSDANGSPPGLYACSGLPTGNAAAAMMVSDPSSPMDFAASPDTGNPTVYITDNAAFAGTGNQAGGIQRYDSNGSGGYNYSYTLGTGSGSTVGTRGLAVDFSAHATWGAGVQGAVLYATTAEPSGNRLIKIVDNGAASAATLVTTAGPSQILAGVSFGPSVVSPFFATQPQDQSEFAGTSATFSSGAFGSGPLTYQWYFQPNCTGSFHPINAATNASLTLSSVGSANVGCYYVVVTNPGNLTAQSQTVSFILQAPPQFTSETFLGAGSGGFQLYFTGTAGKGYTIWTSTDVTLSPIPSTWTMLTTGTFSGGTDSFQDSAAGSNPQQFYIITVP